MIRIYAAIALALILSALLYGAVHVWRKAERVDVAEAAQHDAEAALVDEKKGRADDQKQYELERKQNREITHAHLEDIRRLGAEREQPLVLRVCKSPKLPESPATRDTNAAPAQNDGGEAAQDLGARVGDQLLEFGIQCEANMLTLERLQAWQRAH